MNKQNTRFKVRNAIRNAVRHLVDIPVVYISEEDDEEKEGRGTITDISATGVRVNEASLLVKKDEILRLRLALAPGQPPLVLQCQAIWTTDSGFSVQFLNRDQLLMETLRLALCRD